MRAALFGFLIRLALVAAAVLLVRDAGWVEPVALGLTLVVAHLGLLFWELRFVSISLAHPDLKPTLPKETSPPVILGVDFPPLSHVVNWPEFVGDDTWGINQVVLIYFIATILTLMIFIRGNKKQLVPTGAQNLAEVAVEFVEDGIVMETIGPKGLKYTPLLISFFFFIFFSTIFRSTARR